MAKQEKITPQEAVEIIYGLVKMIDNDLPAKLNKLDGLESIPETLTNVIDRLEKVEFQLTQPTPITNPILLKKDGISRNQCITHTYSYSKGTNERMRKLEAEFSLLVSEVKEIKGILSEMNKPWWKKIIRLS